MWDHIDETRQGCLSPYFVCRALEPRVGAVAAAGHADASGTDVSQQLCAGAGWPHLHRRRWPLLHMLPRPVGEDLRLPEQSPGRGDVFTPVPLQL